MRPRRQTATIVAFARPREGAARYGQPCANATARGLTAGRLAHDQQSRVMSQ
jgi:hypothetical protein